MAKPFVFIIEDDHNLSRIYSIALQNDFETEIIADGSTALMRLAQMTPTLVILDLNLPGLAGRNILASIRDDERLRKTPVILCTADERQAETLRDEADIVMLKPVSPSQLRQMAARLCAPKQQ